MCQRLRGHVALIAGGAGTCAPPPDFRSSLGMSAHRLREDRCQSVAAAKRYSPEQIVAKVREAEKLQE